ncbi:discoidin domain-containing protein [Micromonospora sp. 067-2]|uniref:discoidin domain-containing protein n=1 Tax=Micromonospora sp. 067-2 TaxID=2789270 RepID=UPI00397852A1
MISALARRRTPAGRGRRRGTRLGSGIGALVLLVPGLFCPTPASAHHRAASRNPLTQPFDNTSIWNTPLGSGARYQPTYLQVEPRVTLDPNYYLSAAADGAYRTYRLHSPDGPSYSAGGVVYGGRCRGTSDYGPILFPQQTVIGDATTSPAFDTPNNATAVVYPDGRTISQIQPAARCAPDLDPHGYRATEQDLYGPGTYGGHFGSGLSSIGGQIGVGEISGTAPIRHALQLEIWARRYLTYDTGQSTPGFRWPADRHDFVAPDRASGYCTLEPCRSAPDPQMEMGALLAIPPATTARSLGLTNPAALKVFHALRNYGGYLVDDTAWDTAQIGIDARAVREIDQSDPAWTADVSRIFAALHVVTNNGPRSIGGGGTPRVAPPAALSSPANPAPRPLPRSGWTATASLGAGAAAALDGRTTTGWRSGAPLAAGQWFQLDLGSPRSFNRLTLDAEAFPYDYPQDYDVLVSDDAATWRAVTHGSGGRTTTITFPTQTTRYLRVQSSGGGIDPAFQTWSIAEIQLSYNPSVVFGSPVPQPPTPPDPVPPGTFYSESFDDGLAQDWALGSGASVQPGRLTIQEFTGPSRSVYTGRTFDAGTGRYVYRATISSTAGDDGNRNQVLFNYADPDNTYLVDVGGGPAGTVRLLKRVGGVETVLAVHSGTYSVAATTTIAVTYSAGGRIDVSAIRDAVTTTLFDNVTDTSLTGGAIGVGVSYSHLTVDSVTVGSQ